MFQRFESFFANAELTMSMATGDKSAPLVHVRMIIPEHPCASRTPHDAGFDQMRMKAVALHPKLGRMPPKQSNNSTPKAEGPSKKELDAINEYLAQRPDFEKLSKESSADQARPEVEESAYDQKLREVIAAQAK